MVLSYLSMWLDAHIWPIQLLIYRGGDLRGTKRRLSVPGWEFGGDMSEHLSPGLQLPGGLLPGCEPSRQGLRLPAAPGRAGATTLRSTLSARALAPASRRDKPGRWTCHLKSYAVSGAAAISEPSHLTFGHLQTDFLHRETETPERCAAHCHHQGLSSQPPAQPHLTNRPVGRCDSHMCSKHTLSGTLWRMSSQATRFSWAVLKLYWEHHQQHFHNDHYLPHQATKVLLLLTDQPLLINPLPPHLPFTMAYCHYACTTNELLESIWDFKPWLSREKTKLSQQASVSKSCALDSVKQRK